MVSASRKAAANEAESNGEDAAKATGNPPAEATSTEPKERRKPRTPEQQLEDLRLKVEAQKEKRSGKVKARLAEVEDAMAKAETKLIELATERRTLRAELGLSPDDDNTHVEQGPTSEEILEDPIAAGDTTEQENLRS